MRRLFLAFAVVIFLGGSASAQTTLVTGTVTDTNGVPYAGATLKAQLVLAGAGVTGQPTVLLNNLQQCRAAGQGSAPCQVVFQGTNGPITLDNAGSFSLALQDNALVTPAGTQWLFSVTTNGTPLPLGTGPQSCSATLTITGGSQSISASFSACPALGRASSGAPCGANTQIQFNNAGVCGGDANLTWTPGTATLTTRGSLSLGSLTTNDFLFLNMGAGSGNRILAGGAGSFEGSEIVLAAQETNGSVVSIGANANVTLQSFLANVAVQPAGEFQVGFSSPSGVSGQTDYIAKTSGSANIGVADVAGSPARINLPTATAPAAGAVLASDGGTPQQTSWNILFRFCGTTTACSNTALSGARIILGTVPLTSGTPSTATVTGISPAFTSSSSFVCMAIEQTTATNNLLKVANVSSSSFTITGPNTITDVINYMCVGN